MTSFRYQGFAVPLQAGRLNPWCLS